MAAEDRQLLALCLAAMLCGALWLHGLKVRDERASRKVTERSDSAVWTQQASVEIQP
jgi:hypothetical protein